MKKYALLYALSAMIGLAFSGCATGPKFGEMGGTLPQLKSDSGRIYIYRTTILGTAVQPDVKLDGKVVGSAKPKGFFYVDCAPGNHQISSSTEVTRTLSLTLEPGQVRYVRLNLSMGFLVAHVYPELVDPDQGKNDLAGCSYIGTK
jgi:hypothetical protein